MKSCINLKSGIFIFIFVYTLFSFFTKNIYCKMTLDEFNNYLNSKTLDRIRQIYWNTIIDLGNITIKSRENAKYFHTWNRKSILKRMEKYYEHINNTMNIDIDEFEFLMNKIDLFTLNNTDYLFSTEMPRNFLINFAINIDKYERIKTQKLDGINDYINFYTNDKIVEYLKNKLIEYKDVIEKNFDEIVLNNIKLNFKNVQEYYQNKTKEQLIDIVYGIENFYYNVLNIENEAFYFYQRDELIIKTSKEICQIIALYNKEISIDDIDDFIYGIEYRNFEYINNKKFIESFTEDELFEKILILEKYHKRQQNLTKSLRGLNEYVANMNVFYKENILNWGLSLYPEFYSEEIFDDVSSSDINLKYGEVKEFIQVKERSILLRYAYNIHIYQNEIKSIYSDKVFNLHRLKNDKLYKLILSDTNFNRDLQVKNTFSDYADLHNNNLLEYISHLERNQLIIFLYDLICLYFEKNDYLQPYEIPSERVSLLKLLDYKNKKILYFQSLYYLDSLYQMQMPSTSQFLEYERNKITLESKIGYYNNTYDFLRSTDINYLKKWLRKFETYCRNDNLIQEMRGGMKYNYLDEYSKKDLLEIYDIYISQYPELFKPETFIEFAELNNDITPHKMLSDLFNDLYEGNNFNNVSQIIMKIGFSLTGYYQRKNIQTSFNITKFLHDLNYTVYNEPKFSLYYIYQFFRIINIFPELNNKKLFEIICLNNTTRIINLLEDENHELYFKRDKLKLAKNIQYYFNYTNNIDNKNLDIMTEDELKRYILNFLDNPLYNEKSDLKSRILDGDFSPIIYDYYQSYLSSINDEHLNFIFNNVKNMCLNNYPCSQFSVSKSSDEKLEEIINDIKNVEEFQNPTFFDDNFDFIENQEKDNFCDFLMNSTNKNLFFYTIIANIIKLEECEYIDDIKCQNLPDDIYYEIHYMSRNQMIRYILKVKDINLNMINEEMLPILIKYYMLDMGSDNLYDLTLF